MRVGILSHYPHGVHLVILTHLSLFWVVCYPSRTFPPKEFKREPQNRLSLSPHHQTILSLTFDPCPTTLVFAGYKLVVLERYPWLVCCSCVCYDLRACLDVLLLVFDLLWNGWVSELSFFMSYFFFGLGLAWSWAFPSSIHSLPSLQVGWHHSHAIPLFLPCYFLTLYLLGLFWACCMLSFYSIPVAQHYSLGLYSYCFGLPWPILFFWASSVRFISLGVPGPFQSFILMGFC